MNNNKLDTGYGTSNSFVYHFIKDLPTKEQGEMKKILKNKNLTQYKEFLKWCKEMNYEL